MSCADWAERIAEQTGGEFSAAMEEHLRACRVCAALAEGLESDRLMLAAAPPDAGDVDYVAMRRQLRAAIVRERRVRRYVPALLGAAAAVVGAWVLVRPPAPVPTKAPTPAVSRAWVGELPAMASAPVRSKRVAKSRRVPRTTIPLVDLALLRRVTGVDEPAESGSESPVEMRIATSNPDVTIILLQAKEGSYE
jgi:hypothetical protein